MDDQLVQRLRAAGCVFAEDEARLLTQTARTPAELEALAAQRAAGLPLEHVLGWAQFCGLRIAVGPGVFVPRRRTEFLAEQAAAVTRPGAVVVDLCCGSGAVGVAIVAAVGGAGAVELHAVDVDPVAVRCARRNVAAAGGQVHLGDLYQPLPARLRGHIDVLVANAPYVPTEAIARMPPEARLHEPQIALDGGPDGLDVLRRVIAAAPEWLATGGRLLVETSLQQAPQLLAAAAARGLAARLVSSADEQASVVVATASST